MMMKYLIGLLLLFAAGAVAAQTPTLTFTVETITGAGSVTPRLTWASNPAATTCTASGDWSGAKAPSGTELLAPVTAGKAYGLSCSFGQTQVTVDWTPPTQNTDGSSYTNPGGYTIRYGRSADATPNVVVLDQTAEVASPTATSFVVKPLTPGKWNFTVAAKNSTGVASAPSNPVTSTLSTSVVTRNVTVAVNIPNPPTNVTATAGP
jgi:hypothetical protein